MSNLITPRGLRIAAALVVASAFAAAPVVAQADTTAATGTLSAGGLSVVAPNHAVHRGSHRRHRDRQHTGGGMEPHRLPGRRFSGRKIDCRQPRQPRGYAATSAADASNPAPGSTHPVAIAGSLAVGATAVTIENAAVNTGAGKWDFAADTGGVKNLAVTIPGNATPGAYSDTLTYTIAAGVGA